jgi:2'-5' RNA ligase
MARFFLALWPPPGARPQLAALAADLARRCGGRAVPTDKVHLTLAFLGEIDAGGVARASEVAAAVAAPALELRFDRAGSFPGARVAWAGMSQPDRDATSLATELSTRLRDAGFAIDRRPIVLHATLARRVARPLAEAPVETIAWAADRFALVESDLRTGRYMEKGSWKLGGKEGAR